MINIFAKQRAWMEETAVPIQWLAHRTEKKQERNEYIAKVK